MLKTVEDNEFNAFIGGSFYVMIGFYHPSAEKKESMFNLMEAFQEGHGNVSSATMDISKNKIPDDYGITEDVGPVIVIFKQGQPIKAFNKDAFTLETLATAIAPPGKNITLQ